MLQLVDRRATHNQRQLDRMILELGKWMTEFEMDQCVSFINTVSTSKFDINWTAGDASTQLKIMLGTQRYEQLRALWNQENQRQLKITGTKRLRHRETGICYDGLDADDNPADYEEFYE